MQGFVGILDICQFCQFRGMTSGKEGKLRDDGQPRAHEVEKGESVPVMQFQSRLEWFSRSQCPVARKMDKLMLLKTLNHRGSCRSL